MSERRQDADVAMVEDEFLGHAVRLPKTARIEIQIGDTWRVIQWPLEHSSLAIDQCGVDEVPTFNLAVDPAVILKALLDREGIGNGEASRTGSSTKPAGGTT